MGLFTQNANTVMQPKIAFGIHNAKITSIGDDPKDATRAVITFDVVTDDGLSYPNRKLYVKSIEQLNFQTEGIMQQLNLQAMSLDALAKLVAKDKPVVKVEYKRQLLNTGNTYDGYDFNVTVLAQEPAEEATTNVGEF